MAEIFEKVLVEVMKAVGKGLRKSLSGWLIKSKRNKTIKNFGGKDYVCKC